MRWDKSNVLAPSAPLVEAAVFAGWVDEDSDAVLVVAEWAVFGV
jgi:hypothetical protein